MSFSRLKKHSYYKVAKFAFFAKGLIHHFDQKFEVSLPFFTFLCQIDQKECLAMFLIENELS